MKKTFLLLLLFCIISLGRALAAEDTTAVAGKGSDLGAILFIVGLIVFVIVVRKLYEARNRMGAAKNQQAKPAVKKENFYEPRFWYQCKNCRVTIRKDSPPNSADCFKAVDHIWTQMAEVGTVKYLCRNCSTLIETRTPPVPENCPEGHDHDWEKLN